MATVSAYFPKVDYSVDQKAESQRSFFGVIPKLIPPGWRVLSTYQWQIGHPIRKRGVDACRLCYNALNVLATYIFPQCCRITAHNVFSIFVENSKQKNNTKFLANFKKEEKEGIRPFKEKIEVLKGRPGTGGAFYCSVGASAMRVHEFVIEFAPDGSSYLYQSYLHTNRLPFFGRYVDYNKSYRLEHSLAKQKEQPLKIEEMIETLEIISNRDSSAENRLAAYQRLFGAPAEEARGRLDFFFVPVEYDIEAIPIVEERSLYQRVMSLIGNNLV